MSFDMPQSVAEADAERQSFHHVYAPLRVSNTSAPTLPVKSPTRV
jgi:hypothetical protein